MRISWRVWDSKGMSWARFTRNKVSNGLGKYRLLLPVEEHWNYFSFLTLKWIPQIDNRKHSWAAECKKSIALSGLAKLLACRNAKCFSETIGFSTQQKKCLSSSFKSPSCVPQLEFSTRNHRKENTEFKPAKVDSTQPRVAASAEAVTEQCSKNLRLCCF